MIIPEIATTVNSDPDTPINELLYAMDYKMHGVDSPVYLDKDKLHQAYMTWYAVNSSYYKEAIRYASNDGRLGKLLIKRESLKSLTQLPEYKNLGEIQFSKDPAIINELNTTDGLLRFLIKDGFITETSLTPAEIKSLYFDTGRTDCDPNFPEIIWNHYQDEFASSLDNVLTLYNKDSFWKPGGKYFNDQSWLEKVYQMCNRDYSILTATVNASATCNSSGRYDQSDKATKGVRDTKSFELPSGSIVLKVETTASFSWTGANYNSGGSTMGYAGDSVFGQILFAGSIWDQTSPQNAYREKYVFMNGPHTFSNYTDPFAYSRGSYYAEQKGTTTSKLYYITPS